MTPDNDLISRATPTNSASVSGVPGRRYATTPGVKRPSMRRRVSAVFAGLAVVGFSAALIAPTGMAIAGQAPVEESNESATLFGMASDQAQSIRISVEGASAEPLSRGTFEVYVAPPPEPEPTPEPASADEGGDSSDGGGAVYYSGGGEPAEWMSAAGIASSDWGFVDYIVTRESGWNPNATNPSSGACGLVQALPCSKVPGNGYDPIDNLRWANGYATSRYGSWGDAYNFWVNNSWW